jgi:hypothetical protein
MKIEENGTRRDRSREGEEEKKTVAGKKPKRG